MIVIADTSPLYYLVLVDAVDVLPKLFNRVIVPREVQAELLHRNTPSLVRYWMTNRPSWLEVVSVDWYSARPIPELDSGEEAAIMLAGQLGNPTLLLMDDQRGRREAANRGIPFTGTLGVLRSASIEGLLRLQDVMPVLSETNFYVPEVLVRALLKEEASRMQ